MIQRQRKIGPVAGCPTCGKQPRYFTVGFHLHMLECPPCGLRTGKHESLQQTLDQWEAMERIEAFRAVAS